MNRGSAIRWAERMAVTPWTLDTAQLRFEVGGVTYASPLGILCDFLDPAGWSVAWDGVSRLWHGEQWRVPPDWLARTKAKHGAHDLHDLLSVGSWRRAVTCVARFHEVL